MTEQPRIVVRVAPDGTVTATTHGIYGEKCLDCIPLVENLLEARTVRSAFTEDRYRSAETTLKDISSEHQGLSDQARRLQRLGQDNETDRPDPAGA